MNPLNMISSTKNSLAKNSGQMPAVDEQVPAVNTAKTINRRPKTTKVGKNKVPIDKKSRQTSKLTSIHTSPKQSTQKSKPRESPLRMAVDK